MGLSDPVGMSYNAFLVNTGSKLVLIDTGTGGKLPESPMFRGAGRLMANLRSAGYRPEQVDEVYITHLGPDHIGGLAIGDERAFPNAIVRAARREVDQFLNPGQDGPAQATGLIRFWSDCFAPYIKAGRFAGFDRDTTLTPGIRALATQGHTPGHTSYIVESGGEALLVLGDLVLMGTMQFPRPSLTSVFDADREAAAVQRQRVLRLASDEDYWLAGAHLSFPGIGRVRPAGDGYRWIPVSYSIPQ